MVFNIALDDIVANLLLGFGMASVAEFINYKAASKIALAGGGKFTEYEAKTWNKRSSIMVLSSFGAGLGAYIGNHNILSVLSVPFGYFIGFHVMRSILRYTGKPTPDRF